MSLPSQEELQRLFEYVPSTGELIWKVRDDVGPEWNTRYAGTPALNTKSWKGYLYGTLSGKSVRAHRVIWKLIYGQEPNKIDHINGVRDDNRKDNLRSISTAENQKNTKKRSDNTSGITGVTFDKRRNNYRVYINVNRKQIHIGYFKSLDEAIEARKAAEVKFNFHPNHGRN